MGQIRDGGHTVRDFEAWLEMERHGQKSEGIVKDKRAWSDIERHQETLGANRNGGTQREM